MNMKHPYSLRRIAKSREISHRNTNRILRLYRTSNIEKIAFAIVRDISLSKIAIHYIISVFLLLTIDISLFSSKLISKNPVTLEQGPGQVFLTSSNGIIIATQATLTGILFPIALGLITFIQQSTATKNETEIYYHESLAIQLGSSSIGLIIACALYNYWPLSSVLSYIFHESGGNLLYYCIGSLHILWLCVNAAIGWHFIRTSLAFVNTENRKSLRKRYSTNVAYPNENAQFLLTEEFSRLPNYIYPYGPPIGLELKMYNPYKAVTPCITLSSSNNRAICDVNPRILRWVFDRWWFRTYFSHLPSKDNPVSLYISAPIHTILPNDFTLLSKDGGEKFTAFESLLIWIAFRTSKR